MSLYQLISLSLTIGVILTITPRNKPSKRVYNIKLASTWWRSERIKSYKIHKGKCYYCKHPLDIKQFQAHHVNADYGTLGNELPCDVVPCHIDCHNKEHQRLNARNSLQKLFDSRVLWLKRCYYSLRLVISTVYRFIKPNRKSK